MWTGAAQGIGRSDDFDPLPRIISQSPMDSRHAFYKTRTIPLPAKPLQAQQCVRPDPNRIVGMGRNLIVLDGSQVLHGTELWHQDGDGSKIPNRDWTRWKVMMSNWRESEGDGADWTISVWSWLPRHAAFSREPSSA